jgi:chromosomal replication initiation ATPase DnaA
MDGAGENVSRGAITMAAILEMVAGEFHVSIPALKGPSRDGFTAQPRQAFCWLSRKVGDWSTPQIGRVIDRDHTTVLHAIWATTERMGKDAGFAAHVTKLWAQLASHRPQNVKKPCPLCGNQVN